ncbi:response regulator transcription factor [Sulfurovum sp. XGS-02]|uniref:response regulator transcription factor n=1 Tax=Sulfurovum sp. XGS-02 TaxID=2925411 RepID=UPI00206D1142|nr:response regulator transcription factor [Sulfurovum sp. XGS-02]UPT77408.1 response regulator transcription factor [Sulfurovum sp. XGS-02]
MVKAIDPTATILSIEDNEDLLELETFHLLKEGYKVIGATSTKGVESILEQENIDLMLVDRTLPRIEGSEFVSYLRDKGVTTPVMFVSAKDRDEEIEEGFLRGGDDYLRKPFNIKELLYRVKAILRRTNAIEHERLTARDIIMDFNTRKTYIESKEVELTKLEFELLSLFIKNKNKALGREYLIQNIWNENEDIQKRTVNVTINRLKKKIDPHEDKEYIVPVRGIGYKFQ